MVKKIVSGIFGVMLALHLSGCVLLFGAAAGGTGTALWLSGKLTDELKAPYERAITATKQGLASLDLEISKEASTEKVTQIRSQYADSRKIWIDVYPLTPMTSKIEIRVGMRGDETVSAKILERIKKYL